MILCKALVIIRTKSDDLYFVLPHNISA